MNKLAIIGAGISGLSAAHFLKDKYSVTIFEKDNAPGGLIKCRRVNGSLFHTCGGHVFNSKYQDVLDWFWSQFNREDEFSKANRNSCVFMDRNNNSLDYEEIPYPIENHVYMLENNIQKSFYEDLEEIDRIKGLYARYTDYDNFGDFLRWRFGKTLYKTTDTLHHSICRNGPVIKLCFDLSPAHDRSGDKLWKKGYVKQHLHKAFLAHVPIPVHIDHIGHCLKRKK